MVNQIHPYPSDDDSFWILAVSASSGRGARILDDSADEHGTHYDAQGHMIEAHGTRSVYTRLGPEGQNVDAEFRVTNVKSPTLSMEKFVTQGHWFEARPTGCKMSKEDRSVTLDAVKNQFSLGGHHSIHDS